MLRPTPDQLEHMRQAELLHPQEFSIEVRNRRNAQRGPVQLATERQPSPVETEPGSTLTPTRSAAGQLTPAAAAERAVEGQSPLGEGPPLAGPTAGQPAPEHSAPQLAR